MAAAYGAAYGDMQVLEWLAARRIFPNQ